MCTPLACCLLSCVVDVDLISFSSLPSLFRFRFGHRLFHPGSFSCGYRAVSSVSVSVATRLAYDICLLIRTYADLTFFFSWEVRVIYDLGHRVYYLLFCCSS